MGSERRRIRPLRAALASLAVLALSVGCEGDGADVLCAVARACRPGSSPDSGGSGGSASDSPVEWVTQPAGSFEMGGNVGAEQPVHTVAVPAFDIARSEVTVGQWTACVDDGGCDAPAADFGPCNWDVSGRQNHPVNCVNWEQARSFCAWLAPGRARLCTEAEWEYAARSGDPVSYPWGDEDASCDRAVMSGGGSGAGCGENRTWPVCSKPAGDSAGGVCDLAGNVWEWVEDDYHASYDGAPGDGAAWLDSPRAPLRVLRGGSFYDPAAALRTHHRSGGDPTDADGFGGLRCCRPSG